MTKRNAEMFIYDPEKQYDIADFENTTIKNLYNIGKSLGVRDLKKRKKSEIARLIFSKHVAEQEKTVSYVLNEIIDNVVENCQVNLKLANSTTNPYMNKIQRNRLESSELKMEQLYIITSKEYASHYIFKIGTSVDNYDKLISLNTETINDSDQLYVCYVHDCIDPINVKEHIHMTLHSFRYKNNNEFFVIIFHMLKYIIDTYCTSYNQMYEDCMKILEEENKLVLPEFSDVIPEPIDIMLLELSDNEDSNEIMNYFSHV